ncbi:PepSY domain-containing protein [Enterococcus sp.]|uniref:PepSY domain-containing protein n=1 Tax=Enterococcus sp. TaxID=35783 RepID=UPI000EC5AED1|nr:PepSY domain-containing protein [Enterococcus sp.]HCE12984.1 lysis protein [Enterococcus sp.]
MKKTTIFMGIAFLGLLAGCTQNTTQSSTAQSTDSSTSTAMSTADSTEQSTSSEAANTTGELPSVTVDEAIQIFQDTYPDAVVTSLELDTTFGNYFYKIEGVDDTNEYELTIDAETKAVSDERTEKLDADEQNGVKKAEDQLNTQDLLSLTEISDIAVQEVGGGEATDWDLDKEMNVTYWEVKVQEGNTKTNVKINAQTGEVLETEIDD